MSRSTSLDSSVPPTSGSASTRFFIITQIPDGKPENNFAFAGEAKNKKYATEVIMETHEAWARLINKTIPAKCDEYDITVANSSVAASPYMVATDSEEYKAIPKASPKDAHPIDPSVDKWFYLSGASL
jgi:inorganic pyrophosphatase